MRALLAALAGAALVLLAAAAEADSRVGVFHVVTERLVLRYANASAAHPQFEITKPNRWNEIDFSRPQEIPGKPTVPALPWASSVTLTAMVGIARTPGGIPENVAVWLDFTTDPDGEEPCRNAYSDSANFGAGIRDTLGSWDVPLRDGRLWWAWCARSNYDAATGAMVGGPNIESPRAVLRAPYSTAFVNLGLIGWGCDWRSAWACAQ